MKLKYTDSLGFTKPDAVLGGQSGFAMIDEGQLFEILYEKTKSNKWWLLLFPLDGLNHVYREIEETYYAPKSGRNIGFELMPMFQEQTMIIMCFKDWMSKEQLSKLIRKYIPQCADIPEGKDVATMTYENEPALCLRSRIMFLLSFNDYYCKMETGN